MPNAAAQVAVAISGARTALRKSGHPGNPYHDPSTGEFTTGPGGGAAYGSGTGARQGWPFAPGNRERRLNSELEAANHDLNAFRRGGVDPEDEDHQRAAARVRDLQTQLSAARAHRAAEAAKLMNTQRPVNAETAVERAAREARQRQAQSAHLAQQGQERRRADALLSEIESSGGTARPYTPYVGSSYQVGNANYSRSTASEGRPAGSAEGLRQALVDTSARVSRAAAAVQVIATNLHGATATSDYSRIGSHLNQINSNITQLKQELKGLPADARVLFRETANTLNRAKSAVDRMTRSIQSKITGSKKKK